MVMIIYKIYDRKDVIFFKTKEQADNWIKAMENVAIEMNDKKAFEVEKVLDR